MAVKETKGDGYALYNGVKLPKLPEWDKEKYPYAMTNRDVENNIYTLSVYTGRMAVVNDEVAAESTGTYGIDWSLSEDGAWVDPVEYKVRGAYPLTDYPIIWTNTDIINTADNSVYLSASDPIPLDGMNVIEWDGDTTGLESLSSQCYFVSYNTDLDTTRNVVCTRSYDVTSFELMSEDDGYWALGRYVYYSATSTDDYYLSGIEFRKNSNYHVNLFAYHPIEEPTAPIGYIEYMANPKYHMGKPFRGFIGWILNRDGVK
jgi:hypothetical protein